VGRRVLVAATSTGLSAVAYRREHLEDLWLVVGDLSEVHDDDDSVGAGCRMLLTLDVLQEIVDLQRTGGFLEP